MRPNEDWTIVVELEQAGPPVPPVNTTRPPVSKSLDAGTADLLSAEHAVDRPEAQPRCCLVPPHSYSVPQGSQVAGQLAGSAAGHAVRYRPP
jgi:hypothetical protein